MRRRRVVVTGMGVVSSIARGVPAFTDALLAGASQVSPIRGFDITGYPYANATEVQYLRAGDAEYDGLAADHGRSSIFALLAAREAIADSGLSIEATRRACAGVVLGTTDGESQEIDAIVRRTRAAGSPAEVTATEWARALPNRIADAVCADLHLPGESLMIANACAAGNFAIGYACDLIRAGEAQVMLCGGVDSVCRKTFTGFFRLGAISPDVCRPFDADRLGILTGEGAAMLVIESLDSALQRGAVIHAEILGYGANCDASHMVVPDASSIARCIRLALSDAGIDAGQVDMISAHGTGTRTNDQVEASAIRSVFSAVPPPVVSIKSMIGHTMGAASAMGAVACVLAIRHGFIPPTINHRTADPECPVDCVPNVPRRQRVRVAQNNGFAFGGNNAIVVLGEAPA
jgi:3-oxoacyl-[acyl-carrier-protein] synthase II